MSYSKHGVKVLGLSLIAALGLMAVSAAGAQAQTGWLVGGAFIGATQGVEGEIHPLNATEKHLVLSGEALGAKVKILCKALAVDDGLLFANEAAEGLATFLYSTCETFLNGSPSSNCKPKEPLTSTVKFKAILHNSLTYLLIEPDSGVVLLPVPFPNPLCLLKPSRDVAGSVVMECLTEELKTMTEDPEKRDLCLTDLVNHLIKEASPQSLFGTDGLTFAGKPATLEGIVNLFLPGKASTWAVHI
jgi:hypothetical protein